MPVAEQGVNRDRYTLVPRTMIIVTRGEKILLIKGANNKRLWPGLYNGLGGHIEMGEDILTSAKRELFEESGLIAGNLFLCGIMTVDTQVNPGVCIFIFKGNNTEGNLKKSNEGSLEWVSQTAISELPLVADLPMLIPKILSQERSSQIFFAHSHYDANGKIAIQFI